MRYAVYFAPAPEAPLARTAARWLGRDAYSGQTMAAPLLDVLNPAEIAFHTASARRYGFHATMKAPFRLAPGLTEAELLQAFDTFCETEMAFTVPEMIISRLGAFFALVPAVESLELNALACQAVMAFDRFRAPMTESELSRRNPSALKTAELRNLYRWGYPYVLDTFRFHMTLTGRVANDEAPAVQDALQQWFAPVLKQPVAIDHMALFVEPEPGAPFVVHTARRLGTGARRLTA